MLLADFKTRIANNPLRPSAGKLLCALVLLLFCAGALQAATPGEYRGRVHNAILVLNSLSAGNEAGIASDARTAAALNEVRALLPEKETVVADSGRLQVNNSWLHEALRQYEETRAANPQRADTLGRIKEQLQALEDRLADLEGASAANTLSKDERKARLEQILRRSEYQKKQAESSALARLWQRLLKWIASLFPNTGPLNADSSAATRITQGAQIFVVALSLAVIAYVAWKLAPRLLRNRKAKKRGKREARIVLGERLEPDQTAVDLLAEAEALARSGDLRAAIRKAYIALLCELGDRKIIRLAQHKTNRDYLRAVRGIAPLHDEMRKLTHSFESHWYGFAPATESEWSTFRSGYRKAVTSYK